MKTCSQCRIDKPLAEFCKRKRSKDGLNPYCKTCANERTRLWRLANPDYKEVLTEERRLRKNAAVAKWKAANLERTRQRINTWAKENPAKKLAHINKRRAAKMRAVPKWVNFEAVELIYEEAQFATEFFGVPFHVDHIIPLQSNFCGLHWELNLRVIRGEENLQKSNLVWPDGPMEYQT